MEFCNTMPFGITFQKFETSTFYQSKHVGSFVVKQLTINPYSSVVQERIFVLEEISEAQHIFRTIDFMFNGENIKLYPINLSLQYIPTPQY